MCRTDMELSSVQHPDILVDEAAQQSGGVGFGGSSSFFPWQQEMEVGVKMGGKCHTATAFLLCGWGGFGKCLQDRPEEHGLARRLCSLCVAASFGSEWGRIGEAALPPHYKAISHYQPTSRTSVGAAQPAHFFLCSEDCCVCTTKLACSSLSCGRLPYCQEWGWLLWCHPLTSWCGWCCRSVESYVSRVSESIVEGQARSLVEPRPHRDGFTGDAAFLGARAR